MVASIMTNCNVLNMDTNSTYTSKSLPLPMEVLALKESIQQTHHAKTFAFSLLHLRKMVVPPVEIPTNYKKMRMLKVSGVEVPFTRKQFERRKRDMRPSRRFRLKTIRE